MENARLLHELRQRTGDLQESLEYQTATSDVLKVISRSAFDLGTVLKTVVTSAVNLCRAERAILYRYRDGLCHFEVGSNVSPEYELFEHANPIAAGRDTVAGRAMLEGRTVQIVDALHDPDYGPKDTAELDSVRSMLGVPLLRDGVLTGVFALARTVAEPFTDRQIELVTTFADQAVIAMENARLIAEQQEALEQQTATAEVLQVINASPGDLAPVFDTMLEKAIRICNSPGGVFWFVDGDNIRRAASRGYPAPYEAFLNSPFRLGPHTFIRRLALGEDLVHVDDLATTEIYISGDPLPRAAVDLAGIRTMVAVPLRRNGVLLGAFSVTRVEVRPFTDKQIALIESFAAQAVIAMENARLINEQREALEQQTATAEVLQVINASPGDLAPVFDTMLEKALRLCDAAIGTLFTYDGENYNTAATRGVPPAYAEFRAVHPPVASPGDPLARVSETLGPVHVMDLMAEAAHQAGAPGIRGLVDLGRARTALFVPLIKDATLLGVVIVYRQEVRAFSDKQVALLENFAAQAVIAMENARLITEQREALEQQTATAEVLQVINASPGDLTPVFHAMLEKAMRLCEASCGIMWSYDDDRFHPTASRGLSDAFLDFLKGPLQFSKSGFFSEIVRGAGVLQDLDPADSDLYRLGLSPIRRAFVDLAGVRTILFAALRKDDRLLGVFTIYRQEVRAFTEKQTVLVKNFAAQAVIAMENARLLGELRVRTDELAQRQAELRVTFENMGDGVAMFDATPCLVAWNRNFQQIFDVPDDLLEEHRTYADYIRFLAARGDYGPDIDPEGMIRQFTERAGQHHTTERTRPDGRVIEIRYNPVEGGGFVLIYADITERKRNEAAIRAARDAAEEASRTIEAAYRDLKTAQANLIQAEKMASLGQLTAGIAHEIKNPLNFVNNFAILSVELLNELKETAAPAFAMLDAEKRAEIEDVTGMLISNLEKITEHGRRADGIVRSMLEHSRGKSGERRRVDLNAVVEEALNLAYHGARAQDQSFNITLQRDFAPGIAPIEVNPQDVTRVFLNLFSNGFYAANKRARSDPTPGFEPTLKVSTRDLGDAVEIRVRDNGTGIPSGIIDKLFQPFFTTKPTGEGTGLGLSISYDVVTQQHGGSIAVNSQEGEYTEFTIRLPRVR